jgi:hypothetical protein
MLIHIVKQPFEFLKAFLLSSNIFENCEKQLQIRKVFPENSSLGLCSNFL